MFVDINLLKRVKSCELFHLFLYFAFFCQFRISYPCSRPSTVSIFYILYKYTLGLLILHSIVSNHFCFDFPLLLLPSLIITMPIDIACTFFLLIISPNNLSLFFLIPSTINTTKTTC